MREKVSVSVLQTISFSWAQLTGKSPALSGHLAAATLGLGGVECFRDCAFSCFEVGETEAFSGVYNKKKETPVLFYWIHKDKYG